MSEGLPTVAVVVINFNGAKTIAPTLAAVGALEYPAVASVTVVDNHSTDGSPDLVRTQFPKVRVVERADNRGPNPARNWGLAETQSELVLLLDNDVTLAPDFLRRTAAVFRTAAGVGAVGGQIREQEDPTIVQYNGVHIHFVGAAVQNTTPGDAVAVGALPAGALLLDRRKALDAGRFDEEFEFGWEDSDLTFRLNILGFPVFVVPSALAYHHRGQRGLKYVRNQVRNRWWFIFKNYEARTIALSLPAILLYQAAVAGYCLARGRFQDYLGGCAAAWRGRAHIGSKRRFIQANRRVRDRNALCGRGADILRDAGASRWVHAANAALNRVLAAYWWVIRPCLH